MGGFAWVTLATNDSYSLGALVLAHSLKQVGTSQQLAVLVTPGVTSAMREKLSTVFDLVKEVNILDSRDETNLRLLKRPELGITFTKLHCWRLTQYDKCVFLDADTLVLQNCDELFEREELSAAPDVGWPDCFNSGVFVYRPSNETFEKLIQFALEKGSFDGGDQGLLNLYFSDWSHQDISKHLPFIYNMCSTACYSYLPAFKQFGGNAKIIHFIGATKPWLQYFNPETRKVQPSGESNHLQEVLQRWWDIFCSLIHPQLTPNMAGLAGAFAQLTLGVARTPEQDAFESLMRKQAWEVGNIDYLGKDSFDNIWSKISETLAAVATPEPIAPEATSAIVEPVAVVESPAPEVAPETVPPQAVDTSKPIPLPSATEPTLDTSQTLLDTPVATETPAQPTDPPKPPPAVETPKETEEPKKDLAEPKTEAVSEVRAAQVPESPQVTETPKPQQQSEPLVSPVAVEKVTETPKPQQQSEPSVSPVAVEKVTETQAQVEKTEAPKVEQTVSLESPQVEQKESEPIALKQPETIVKPASEEPKKIEPVVPVPTEQAAQVSAKVEVNTQAPAEVVPAEIPKESKPEEPKQVKAQSEAPKAKVIEPTPPTTPGSAQVLPPQLKETKEALAVETSIPETPPPTSTETTSAPTPPPRKVDKPKKTTAKPKK